MGTETTSVVPDGCNRGAHAEQPVKQKHAAGEMISIWFFVGCLFTVYGLLILFAGIRESSGREVSMASLHAQVWWGVGLLMIGLVYVGVFRPRK